MDNRQNGSLIAMESGTAYAYALHKLQDRGRFFIDSHEGVYAGEVVGENTRGGDMVVNVTKSKKHTNMRASGSDDKAILAPSIKFSLEEALEYIQNDEYVEVTPKAMRIRKVFLNEHDRKKQQKV
jgi:GTP-binding protein